MTEEPEELPTHLCRTCDNLEVPKSARHPAVLGECRWGSDRIPHWAVEWLEDEGRHGPKRTVWRDSPVACCGAWNYKVDPEAERFK